MINQDLVSFIQTELASGSTHAEIKKTLLAKGWSETVIEDSFLAAQTVEARLPGTWQLLKEAWLLFEKNFWKFVLTLLAPTALSVLLLAVTGPHTSGRILVWILVWCVVMLVVESLAQLTLLHLIIHNDKQMSVGAAFKQSLHLLPAYWWIGCLTTFFVIGGYVLFAVPGILFGLWFCFASFVLVAEHTVGLKALVVSRDYVWGHSIEIFIRLLALSCLIFLAVGLLRLGMPGNSETTKSIGSLISFTVIGPLFFCFMYRIFEHLRLLKASNTKKPSSSLVVPTIVSSLGWALIAGLIIMALLVKRS